MCICIVNTSYPLEYKNRRQHIFFMYFDIRFVCRNDHTTMTAPLPVCSAKLSIVWLG